MRTRSEVESQIQKEYAEIPGGPGKIAQVIDPSAVVVVGEELELEAQVNGNKLEVWGPNLAGSKVRLDSPDGEFTILAPDDGGDGKMLTVTISAPPNYTLAAWRTDTTTSPFGSGKHLHEWKKLSGNDIGPSGGVQTKFKAGKKKFRYFDFFVVALPQNADVQRMLVYDPIGRGGQF